MEPTVVIAGIGLVTTASSPLLQSWLTARNAEAAWRRDALAGVYADALAHAQSLESLIERVTDPYGSHAKRAEVPHVDLIAARLRLHAPQAVLAAGRRSGFERTSSAGTCRRTTLAWVWGMMLCQPTLLRS